MDSQSAIHDRRDLLLAVSEQDRSDHKSETTDVKTEIVIGYCKHGSDRTVLTAEESLFQSLADSCGSGTNQSSLLNGEIKWRSL
jgi:hypothetical protein